MRKIIAVEYLSLDGVMENPAWTMPFWSDELGKMQRELLFESDALLLGRVTYEGFSQAWPGRTDPDGFADRINSMPKHVATSAAGELTWSAQRIEGDVPEEVARLREQSGGHLLVYGSGELLHSLLARGLVDEWRLMVFPVVIGSGKRLFKDGAEAKLTLTDSKTTQAGVAILTYQPSRAAA